jgi:hypothetical protein
MCRSAGVLIPAILDRTNDIAVPIDQFYRLTVSLDPVRLSEAVKRTVRINHYLTLQFAITLSGDR